VTTRNGDRLTKEYRKGGEEEGPRSSDSRRTGNTWEEEKKGEDCTVRVVDTPGHQQDR
jgi:hypothetical protein